MYCNYCDSTHRTKFGLTQTYASNSTFDAANLARVQDDLYHMDNVNRNYETYMDYWCSMLYDPSKFALVPYTGVRNEPCTHSSNRCIRQACSTGMSE